MWVVFMLDSPGDSELIWYCTIQPVEFCFSTLHFFKQTKPFDWHILLQACGGAASRIH